MRLKIINKNIKNTKECNDSKILKIKNQLNYIKKKLKLMTQVYIYLKF